MNWAESEKWSNTHKANLAVARGRMMDDVENQKIKKFVWGETTNTTKKILGILLKARLESFIKYENPVRKFFLAS